MSHVDLTGQAERRKRKRGDRIARLRTRLQNVPEGDPATEGLLDVLKGVLDLLADESRQ